MLLSYVAAGTEAQIASLLEAPGLMATIVELARSAPWKVRKQAIWTVSNVVNNKSHTYVESLVDLNGIDVMCEALCINNARIQYMALVTIDKILSIGVEHGKNYQLLIYKCRGMDMIEDLQHHPNDEIYRKARAIVENFFQGDDWFP